MISMERVDYYNLIRFRRKRRDNALLRSTYCLLTCHLNVGVESHDESAIPCRGDSACNCSMSPSSFRSFPWSISFRSGDDSLDSGSGPSRNSAEVSSIISSSLTSLNLSIVASFPRNDILSPPATPEVIPRVAGAVGMNNLNSGGNSSSE